MSADDRCDKNGPPASEARMAAMRGSRYAREAHEAYFKMIAVVGTRWEGAVGHADYRSSTGWNLLTNLWRDGRVKISAAYEFMRDVKSPTTRRQWLQKAIADGIVECSDTELVAQLRSGKRPTLPRGQSTLDVWLNPAVSAAIDAFMDDVLDELLRTADAIRSPAHTVGDVRPRGSTRT